MLFRNELFLLLIFLLTQLAECQWGGGGRRGGGGGGGGGRHWRGRGRGGNWRKFGGGGGGGDYDDDGGTIKIVIKDNLEGDRGRGGRGRGPPDDFRPHPGGPPHRRPHGPPHGRPHGPPPNGRPPHERPPNRGPELDSFTTESDNYGLSASEWRMIEHLKSKWESGTHSKSEAAQRFPFWMDREASFQRAFGGCSTPNNKVGRCHFVQHCPLPHVINDFDTFLTYTCFIRNRFVGICCPDSFFEGGDGRDEYQTEKPAPKPPPPVVHKPPTTAKPHKPANRPTTHKPKPPANDNYYNGACGLSDNVKIIGGALASPKEWLWMAAILTKSTSNQYCGGALITSQHILTAAHCLRGVTPEEVIVRLGEYDFSDSADPEAQDFDIDHFRIHPKYDRITHRNDIAILTLKSRTEFTEAIRPICMPQKNRNYAEQLAIVAGWGHTSFGGPSSKQLRQVSIPVWNQTSCEQSYSVEITKVFLCAGNRNGGKDSCQGDSGGPLMLQGPNKRWMIIGVVSWGVKCGEPRFPGVYTRISEFVDWIRNNSRIT